MKHPKLLTIAAATVVVSSSAFVASGTASAADLPGAFSTEYVNSVAQLTPNPDVLPVGSGWNSYDADVDAPSFGLRGVTTPAPTTDAPLSAFVLTHATSAPIGSLTDIVTQGKVVSTGTVLPVFVVSAGTESEIVVPANGFAGPSGQATFSADAEWQVAPFDSSGSLNETGTIAEVQAAIEAHADGYSIVGYGVEGLDLSSFPGAQTQSSTDGLLGESADVTPSAAAPSAAAASDPATVSTLTVDNATTHFTPTPTLTLGSASTTASAFSTTGVTVSATGFLPGETVTSGYATDASGDALPATFVADADGAVTGTVVGPVGVTAGTYSIVLVGTTSAVSVATPLAVTADPAVTIPAAPVPVAVRTAATFAG